MLYSDLETNLMPHQNLRLLRVICEISTPIAMLGVDCFFHPYSFANDPCEDLNSKFILKSSVLVTKELAEKKRGGWR